MLSFHILWGGFYWVARLHYGIHTAHHVCNHYSLNGTFIQRCRSSFTMDGRDAGCVAYKLDLGVPVFFICGLLAPSLLGPWHLLDLEEGASSCIHSLWVSFSFHFYFLFLVAFLFIPFFLCLLSQLRLDPTSAPSIFILFICVLFLKHNSVYLILAFFPLAFLF